MRNITIMMILLHSLLFAERNLGTLAFQNNESAILELRSMGNDGLQLLLQKYQELPLVLRTQKQQQIFDIIDRVAGQKHAVFSGLYWYTDIDTAKKVAAQQNKPLLLLRLLGRLDEEFC
ncbi:hypothetical protein [Candidatus Uabimicrobium amorphum]|uniref:Uncharacterized protein n=1 Tax=Uabimicrobium amorphum TaxID=2596890 RepID=A0A5S9ILQ6_UABAM|nr:hypothetical protein [Candidatus Uabimicrobium amorphum]BBM83860.1 hypothetical protein UABAM_02215 [Candidatus Uabimicrobium amorphum]